tara:strand:+ start:683 stop:1087 length:405 start_codon:yes stop_codon:yes gene_type:complete
MNLDKITLFEFDPKSINWKFKATQSKRRMKLYIKMKSAETAQWDALKDAAKPPEMSDNEFARILFYKGLNGFMEELTEKVNSLTEDEKAQIMNQAEAEGTEPEPEPTREELAALGKLDSIESATTAVASAEKDE